MAEKNELVKNRHYIYKYQCEETKRRRMYKVRFTGEFTSEGNAICVPKQGKQYKGSMECEPRKMMVIEGFADSGESTREHTPGSMGGVKLT